MRRNQGTTPSWSEAMTENLITTNNKRAFPEFDTLYSEVKQLIQAAKQQIVSQVNQGLVLTYWHIGKRIQTDI